ncbi:MAG: 16S rRNA (cytosine(1402)-N(4))-methyltransferase RsmH [Actinomycetaceae bacterium]|nr:16S rRNA (cytosine(1402)-N(4))-methyltransferase RsmH [Actinomycetaceae bacterium]MDY6083030.1 16S rRNA (cytosine(1402)-N(4))-methyltransferase RsmH [Actinomycetaceae bacterium]
MAAEHATSPSNLQSGITSQDPSALHIPVLLHTCIELLSPAIDSMNEPVMVDCTLGMGGHTEAFLRTFPSLRVIGIDRDEQALSLARARLSGFGSRFRAVHTTYDRIESVVDTYAPRASIAAILMDLGMSSLQIDDAARGFSYSQDAPLDMRMDPSRGRSAAELIAQSSEEDLTHILRVYGEERFARSIAHHIVSAPEPMTRTSQLAQAVKDAIPAPARRRGGNPAKRTFQALRIAVNSELELLEAALPAAEKVLAPGGRLCVEAYQSLEDRIVKHEFRRVSAASPFSGADPLLPTQPHEPEFSLVVRKAIKADEAEIARNPRAASVRVRALEKRSGRQDGSAYPYPDAQDARSQSTADVHIMTQQPQWSQQQSQPLLHKQQGQQGEGSPWPQR